MALLERRLVSGVHPLEWTPRRVGAELRRLLAEGWRLSPDGEARSAPEALLASGYTPKHAFRLFDATFFLTHPRHDDSLGFFVAYVQLRGDRRRRIHPRIFYKDVSLMWRSATHLIRSEQESWIGKGEEKLVVEDGVEVWASAEETTNLPFEMQGSLDELRGRSKSRRDARAVPLVLRRAPDDRYQPYADFLAPRRRARSDPRNRIHGGRPVAWFQRPGQPESLRFARGYGPDFRRVIERFRSGSRLYAGPVEKLRFLSENRRIQYLFFAGPHHVWLAPPQALTTELSSFGVRTIDVDVDDDLCVPGYEYHFLDESLDPPALHSQIPAGFAGPASEVDPQRADASRWLERLPVIARFRQQVLGRRRLPSRPRRGAEP